MRLPGQLKSLLAELWAQQADGVVFLSGDEHRSGFVSAEIYALDADGEAQGPTVRLHSIHSSALYAPWPFAVTDVEALAEPDEFTFAGPEGQVLRCRVSAWTDFPAMASRSCVWKAASCSFGTTGPGGRSIASAGRTCRRRMGASRWGCELKAQGLAASSAASARCLR